MVIIFLAVFRIYIDGIDFSITDNQTNRTNVEELTANVSIVEVYTSIPELSVNERNEDLERTYEELEKMYLDLEKNVLDFEDLEEQNINNETEVHTHIEPVETLVDDLNASSEEIDNQQDVVGQELVEPTKIVTTIKINSFISVTSTIISNSLFLNKNLNEKSKIAEAQFDIRMPEHNVDVSVTTDILFDPEMYAKDGLN